MCTVPKPFPREFREDVVRVARNVVRVARSREPGVTLKEVVADFGIAESCLRNWLRAADVEDGAKPGLTAEQAAELRELRRRNRLLEQENEVLPAGGGVSVASEPASKMMYPLVRELADDGVPIAVTCRVLNLARQPYYRWLEQPATNAEVELALEPSSVRRPP